MVKINGKKKGKIHGKIQAGVTGHKRRCPSMRRLAFVAPWHSARTMFVGLRDRCLGLGLGVTMSVGKVFRRRVRCYHV